MFIYRPPKYDKKVFFQELSKTISQAINKYDNISVTGDLNSDVSRSKALNGNHFCELIDTFSLTNLIKTLQLASRQLGVPYKMCYSQINQVSYKKLAFVKRN